MNSPLVEFEHRPVGALRVLTAVTGGRAADVLPDGATKSSHIHGPPDEARVPAGWCLTTLGTIASRITDRTHRTPKHVESGIPFFSVKDFSAGRLDFSCTRFTTPHEQELLYRRCDPRRGDILIGRIGTLASAVVVHTDPACSLFVSATARDEQMRLLEAVLERALNGFTEQVVAEAHATVGRA